MAADRFKGFWND
jgi:DNA-binding CsgD family transcriptional regulator